MTARDGEAAAARLELERVLQSPIFARNERLSRFLRFVVERHLEGRSEDLKESVIGIEVFRRQPGYNPKRDPIVRTEASRLRARLSQYYMDTGNWDTVVIELPRGGYIPLFRPAGTSDARRGSPAQSVRPLVAALASLAIIAGAAVWWIQRRSAPIPIAVLPLVDLSPDSASEYFANGLTGEIIRNLSIIDGLAVRSQTSAFFFKGKPRNVHEAGKQLHVDYILDGSVLRDRLKLRITAQLVRVRDDFPLWSDRYDRDVADMLAVQDEISRAIVNSLRMKLGRGRRRYEISAEAYDLYLQGRALAMQGMRGANQSVDSFERAIAKDASFAPAYAGLAAAFAVRTSQAVVNYGPPLVRTAETAQMRIAAEKALELDPMLAEAHGSLGMIRARDAQWKQAEKSFRRALELNPNDPLLRRHFVMHLLLPLGRVSEAIAQLQAAAKADPLTPAVQMLLAYVLIAGRRFNEAAEICLKTPVETKDRALWLARARLCQGRIPEAIRLLEALNSNSELARGTLGYAYARAGRRADAEKVAAELPVPIQQALIFAGLGDKGRVFEALDSSIPLGPARIGTDLLLPEYAFLHGDQRLKALRQKLGLPD